MSKDHPAETDVVNSKHEAFLTRKLFPLNGESSAESLRQHYITPIDLFYVRCHGTIPTIDVADYRLKICGSLPKTSQLTFDELTTRFERIEQTVTLQCAGLRRSELDDVHDIAGIPWDDGAISTATWAGVRLADVLHDAGLDSSAVDDEMHVAFSGADCVEKNGTTLAFGGSIPLNKALSNDVLLAFGMNGKPLPAAHGAPLRIVVPGYLGARSIKWVTAISVQTEPSDNFFEQHAYKLFPPEIEEDDANWDEGEILGVLPINAVICSTREFAAANGESMLEITGYAVSGGGRAIERVELSTDAGDSWRAATVNRQDNSGAWAFWTANLTLPNSATSLDVIARAWDSDQQTQPEHADDLWNFKGYYNNAWHHVHLRR